ncbi:MAG: T9SS type A sorting domain-containing protein [Salinivirgaceae bacterium]|nr:T9SS type A sorting domain-containing protein [Salinivirgaceae bacterium]
MKNLMVITMFVSLLSMHKTSAQTYFNFPTSNAVWNSEGDNMFSNQKWYFRYAIYGDTVIESQLYHKIYNVFQDTVGNENSEYVAAIRENNNRQVLCKLPNYPEVVLYDFNLEVGDSIHYPLSYGMCYNGFGVSEGEEHTLRVIDIDSVLINNEYRKRWFLSGGSSQTWVEGIGSMEWNGLFNPLVSMFALCGDSYHFSCFKHNEVVLFQDNNYCDCCFSFGYSGVNSSLEAVSDALEIFPNPSKDNLHIHIDQPTGDCYSVSIYSILGEQLYSQDMEHGFDMVVDVSAFESGVYLVRVVNTISGVEKKSKFIVE